MQQRLGTSQQLGKSMMNALAAYRYQVFVGLMGWNLPCNDGIELDQFDRDDTIHIVGIDEREALCDWARLFPTTRPYLLSEVFPFLLERPPHGSETWELSRFSTAVLRDARHGRGR